MLTNQPPPLLYSINTFGCSSPLPWKPTFTSWLWSIEVQVRHMPSSPPPPQGHVVYLTCIPFPCAEFPPCGTEYIYVECFSGTPRKNIPGTKQMGTVRLQPIAAVQRECIRMRYRRTVCLQLRLFDVRSVGERKIVEMALICRSHHRLRQS